MHQTGVLHLGTTAAFLSSLPCSDLQLAWLPQPAFGKAMLCSQMMQEWLGQHKLDRKALAALAGNAQAVQVYDDYLHSQVQDVMEDLLAEFDEPAAAPGMHHNMLHMCRRPTC